MRPNSGYIPVEIRAPLRGLYVDAPSTQIDPSFSPRMLNVDIRSNVVSKRSGYHEIYDVTLDGDVMGLVDFQTLALARTFIAFTTTRQYELDEGNDTWNDITATKQSHLIQAVDTGSNWFKISGDHRSVFTVSSRFAVEESTQNNGDYVVTAVAYSGGLTQIDVASVTNSTADGIIVGVEHTVTVVDQGTKTFTVAGDQSGIYATDDIIVIEDSTDIDGYYTVSSVGTGGGNTTIVVTEAIPGSTADGNIQKLQLLTTIGTDYFDWVIATDDNYHRIYVTNGRDRVRYWDGAGRFIVWYPEYPNFVTCQTLEVFYSHLVLGNVTTSSTETKLVAWSDTSDFEEFEDNNSGTLLIPALSGEIKRVETLGDRLIIYSNDSIGSLMYLGYPVVFSAEVLLQGSRLVSGQAIVSIGSAHLYCSEENVFFFDGTRSIRAVGDSIKDLYTQELNTEYGSRLFTFNDVARGLIYIVVPVSSTVSTTFVLNYNIFDLRKFVWTQITFTDRPQALGFYIRRSSPSWVDPPDVPWEDDYGIWYDEGERVNFPVRVLGSGSEVFMCDEIAGTDDGTDVTATFETKDFVVPEADQSLLGRWGELELDLAGDEVSIYYSTDQGQTWEYPTSDQKGVFTQNLVGGFESYRINLDVVSRTLRIKLSSTNYFAFRWLRLWVRPSGPR